MHCDFAFFIGGTRENAQDLAGARAAARLRRRQGVHGLLDRLAAGRGRRRRAADLQGDPAPRRLPRRGRVPPQRAQASAGGRRPALASGLARRARRADRDQRLVKLAHETGKRIHVLHISTQAGDRVPARSQGCRLVRGDAASPHAGRAGLLRAARHPRADESAGPRSADHRDGIWRGIAQGIVDVLGSDHAPHTLEEKAKPYPATRPRA